VKAALWRAMMLAWLGGLLLGAWQALPLLRDPAAAPTQDLLVAVMWLVIGFAAWALALNLGRRRYWGRR
jgi:hypothetical protein